MLKHIIVITALSLSFSTAVLADDLAPANSSGTGSDAGALNVLQPANPTALQSADARNGGINLNQPTTTNDLQPAGDKTATAQLLQGEASGTPQGNQSAPPDAKSQLPGLLLGFVAVTLVFSSVMIYRISKYYETSPPVPSTSPEEPSNTQSDERALADGDEGELQTESDIEPTEADIEKQAS